MFRLKYDCLLYTLFGMVLCGCSTETIEPDRNELYSREFIKNFGVPASNHDWTTAKRATVTVISDKTTDVKVYADVDGRRYLFARSRNITGTNDISFDVPSTVSNVIVRANGKNYTVNLSGTSDLSKSENLPIEPDRQIKRVFHNKC